MFTWCKNDVTIDLMLKSRLKLRVTLRANSVNPFKLEIPNTGKEDCKSMVV